MVPKLKRQKMSEGLQHTGTSHTDLFNNSLACRNVSVHTLARGLSAMKMFELVLYLVRWGFHNMQFIPLKKIIQPAERASVILLSISRAG